MASDHYSIGVSTNRFALFDLGDEDPIELIQKQEQEKEARKKAKISEKEVKPKAAAPLKGKVEKKPTGAPAAKEDPQKNAAREDRRLKPDFKNQRGDGRSSSKDGREKENYRSREDQDRGNQMERDNDRYHDDGGFRKSGSDMGGRGRGGRGGGGPGFRGRTFQRGGNGRPANPEVRKKREFERQSGSNKTGVKPMEKRDGSGGFNWGNHKDDWTNEEDLNKSNDKENWDTSNNIGDNDEWTGSQTENPPWKTETANENVKAGSKAGSQAGDGAALAVEGNDSADPPAPDSGAVKEELTLDEWKALKGAKSSPAFNVRKPGEGEDQTQWKKMYALRKKNEEDENEEEYEYIECPQRVGRQRHVLDIDFRYKDSRGGNTGRGRGRRGGGGDRGDRGGDRGERGDRGDRGDRFRGNREPRGEVPFRDDIASAKEAPKVDDEHDFPSLN